MSQFSDSRYKTFPAGAAIGAYLRVKISSGKLAAAGLTDDTAIGTLTEESFADGDIRTVCLWGPTQKAVAAAAITAGAKVFTAAGGKVSVSASTGRSCGIALEAAGADGDVIEILPVIGETAVT